VTALTSIKNGHDINYFIAGGARGCAGAMAYYTEGGEPPGQWAGRVAGLLGLAGVVDADLIRRLYMERIAPGGEVLGKRHAKKADEKAEQIAVAAYVKAHPFASVTEVAEFRASQRARRGPKSVPYFDITISAVKSVSVLHASYRIAAMQARQAGAVQRAAELDARADAIEQAIMDAAREAVKWLEAHHARTRTGYHSKTTGEWRDASGLCGALFLHHLSRDGDPQLHVHIPILNRAQRADGADDIWRGLFGRDLFLNKLGLAALVDRFLERRLRQLGYAVRQRADGNGCEVDGVDPAVIKQFSSRATATFAGMAEMAAAYEAAHGHPPSQRTLWLMGQQAAQNTRRPKAEARRTVGGTVHRTEPTAEERLAELEAQSAASEVRALSTVYPVVEAAARAAAPPAPHRADGGGAVPVLEPLTPVPDAVLGHVELCELARIAVANVQKRHAAWSWAQLRFEAHRALGPGGTPEHVDQIAALAVSGRAGTNVVQVGAAGDVTDVSSLGVRATDGVSVYRPPNEARWCTIAHLDLEAWIVAAAREPRRQRVGEADARAAVAGTDLTAEQAEAVVRMLTSAQASVPLDAAAGSGKSHTVAVFAELWTRLTGGRVIGLTTSTNAARVLQGEMDEQVTTGLAEAYNIAEFLGKVKGSDELRRPVPVYAADVLVVDEATQCSTADMAAIQQAAHETGARANPVGDTAQLGAVDAGGIFDLLAREVDGARLHEVLRFRNRWELAASLRLRNRDPGVFAVYDRRGRIRGGDHEAVFDQAAAAYLGYLLRGRDVLLLAGSNAEAADLARRVQARLVALGRVQAPEVELADGNHAGVGDLLRARLNTRIDAGGQQLSNRDTIRVVSIEAGHVWAQRKTGPDTWTDRFRVAREYLAESAELDYAGNVHVAQGRTVDIGLPTVTQSLDRRGLLVGMTRGRELNIAFVETGNTAPKGRPAYEQATPESVLAGVLDRDADELSATATMRAGQDWAWGTGHVMHLWGEAVSRSLFPQIDRAVMARLPHDQAQRYAREWAREAFHARLREAQLAGHDVGELIDRVMADPLDGARSVSAVLHSRLNGLGLETRYDVPWSARTPDGAPAMARELAEGLDARVRVMGERAAAKPEPWVLRHLGQLAPDASPALRAEWERRAGSAAAYREAAGITDPGQAVAYEPHAGNPELETARRAAMHALEIRDEADILAGMSRGELEALVAEGQRAKAAAPPDVTARLRTTGQAASDTWAQAAAARVEGKAAEAASAETLAASLEAEHARLDVAGSAYEQWSEGSAETRDRAGKAAAELGRRQPEPNPDGGGPDVPDTRDLATWWRDFDAHCTAIEAKWAEQQAAAAAAGEPWPPLIERSEVPPGRLPAPPSATAADVPASGPVESAEPAAAASDTRAEPDAPPADPAGPPKTEAGAAPPGLPEPASPRGAQPYPPPPAPEPRQEAGHAEPDAEPAAEPGTAADVSAAPTVDAARLDALQADAEEAAGRAEADRAAAAESSEYTARTRAEAGRPEAQPAWQAELADDQMEPEA
jgi:conjugative relaxase-like TrwC/TraI family protein